mmetsp:Transcript_65401/g.96790  ORF Transcript_65401/g.96790 Transcript_65401/m.96790 type:complete len:103 (-) Transcript_65401:131-439(-)
MKYQNRGHSSTIAMESKIHYISRLLGSGSQVLHIDPCDVTLILYLSDVETTPTLGMHIYLHLICMMFKNEGGGPSFAPSNASSSHQKFQKKRNRNNNNMSNH